MSSLVPNNNNNINNTTKKTTSTLTIKRKANTSNLIASELSPSPSPISSSSSSCITTTPQSSSSTSSIASSSSSSSNNNNNNRSFSLFNQLISSPSSSSSTNNNKLNQSNNNITVIPLPEDNNNDDENNNDENNNDEDPIENNDENNKDEEEEEITNEEIFQSKSIISKLSNNSIHRICSGQVIISLTSVIKELIENSLDASSTFIEIKFTNMGLECIEVSDNGNGISKNNFENIVKKHNTSKLINFTDLENISTFGFRGEALSSISCMAELQIFTKTESDKLGNLIYYDHDQNITKIEQLLHNYVSIFGLKDFKKLQKVDFIQNDPHFIKINGFISLPEKGCGRSSNDRQFLYVNNRPVDLPKITKCINEIYKEFNRNQYPIFIYMKMNHQNLHKKI
ncbi:predicted protein [Naegleria gruberi]|uniref:Predicted protein n=1 Tax=Naegleria gruberi TaxID=5762 RepID=D2VU26_NAEGR|nr:uncharacterized protein NAEGRDRAFT_72513 [Naegleria gruberi]EFC39616.1 predicted protein [Naegleria gruberi]|eukprot:XP_002672360.1 predicted protein [Naegleria gruberi strain NEG-M]